MPQFRLPCTARRAARAVAAACLALALCPQARADSFPAFGVNDLRSDGIVLPLLGWDGLADLDLLASANIRLYRARVRMDCVGRTGGGAYDFGSSSCFGISYDALVGELAKRGQVLLPVLMAFDNGAPAPPLTDAARTAFAEFAAAVADRYGPNGRFWGEHPELTPHPIRAWEIWNEENSGDFWGGAPSATAYADLFAATRAALRGVDPQARVVVGGLAFHGGTSGAFVEPDAMIAALSAGNRNAFDAVAIHPYTDARGRLGSELAADAMALTDNVAESLRRRTGPDAFGAPRQQIWITELGWSSLDAADQEIAQGLRDFVAYLDQGARANDNVGPFVWYAFRDNQTKSSRDDQLGLRRTSLTGADAGAKPVWGAFTGVLAQRAEVTLPDALQDAAPYDPAQTAPAAPPAATSCPGAATRPTTAARRATVRTAALCLIAALRAGAGLAPLSVNASLARRAKSLARSKAAGTRPPRLGSGSFWTTRRTTARATATALVASWRNKTATRQALLAPTLRIGIGSAPVRRGRVVFALGVRAR